MVECMDDNMEDDEDFESETSRMEEALMRRGEMAIGLN